MQEHFKKPTKKPQEKLFANYPQLEKKVSFSLQHTSPHHPTCRDTPASFQRREVCSSIGESWLLHPGKGD